MITIVYPYSEKSVIYTKLQKLISMLSLLYYLFSISPNYATRNSQSKQKKMVGKLRTANKLILTTGASMVGPDIGVHPQ
jgi:hypothetical protein